MDRLDTNGDEEEPLLSDEEYSGHSIPCPPNPYADLPVYTNIHRVRHEVIASLEDPYSLEQLRAPRINVAVVRPLVNRLWDHQDISIIYCLLVNKLQFLREQAFQVHQTIDMTRAHLCELVALKVLRKFDEEHPERDGLLLLAKILVAGFEPFQNAPEEIIKKSGHAAQWTIQYAGGYERKSTVLEVAIISQSKMFLSMPAVQRVMDAIFVGQITYTPSSFIDILPDHYKHKPITLYNPKKAIWLNQYRLMVPRTRNLLDIGQFIVLLVLYILTMKNRKKSDRSEEFTTYELVFSIYALGWVLDEFASILEHGWNCYTQNMWAFLDTIFAVIYLVYFVLRCHNLATGDIRSGTPALDILSAGAPVLIPRLAFNFLSENMLFVSLRAMMADFVVLTLLAVWCFAGFLLSMVWLSEHEHHPITIAKWMLWVWFGLDGTGIQKSITFHWLIGPTLMVTFAFLGNTLFLTILVAMLSSTFSKIAGNAAAEIQFRRAVLTFEGVKSDAIFAYQPPFNLLALFMMLPLKFIVSPRWFHKINVTAVRTINAPLLILISLYERRYLWIFPSERVKSLFAFWDFARFSAHGDTQAVFEIDPPASMIAEFEEADDGNASLDRGSMGLKSGSANPAWKRTKTRKDSFGTTSVDHLADIFHEHGGGDILGRLEGLEESIKRIEAGVGRLGQDMGEDTSDEEQISSVTTKRSDR